MLRTREGKIVEIDQSKFRKRKYHRGRRVDGCWVFGGIERDSNKCFFEIVDDRTMETLLEIIKQHIKPGTTIITNCWKAYACLKDHGYTHLTVNHSKEFKNPENGACTNKIGSTWHALKLSLPRSGTQKQLYDSYFFEYVVRKKYLNDSNDALLEFLRLVSTIYNPNILLTKKREDLADDASKHIDEHQDMDLALEEVKENSKPNTSTIDLFD